MKQSNLYFDSDTETNDSSRPPLAGGQNPEVTLFSDGACSGNPGPGGWAYILRHADSGKETESSGSEWETTNNRMELQAVIEGLKKLNRGSRVHVVTDSSYVKNGITQWIHGWKSRGWMRKTSGGLKPVKNVDLWKQLDDLISLHDASFEQIRGHAGHAENERCDELAVKAYRDLMSEE